MNRTLGLVAVWLVFAATAVGVGFTAAGLIDEPLAGAVGLPSEASGPEATPGTTVGTPGSATTSSTTTRPSPTTKASPAKTSATTSPPKSSPPRTRPPGTSPTGTPAPVTTAASTRGLSTSGGYVSATCTSGGVRLSASPAVGWELKKLSDPGSTRGEAEFEETSNRGREVDVTVWCRSGKPVFAVETDSGDSSGSDSSDNDGSGSGSDD